MAAVTTLLAHPLTEVGQLRIPPLAAAVVAMVVVATVARLWPGGRSEPAQVAGDEAEAVHPWAGGLRSVQVGTRALAVALLLLVVVAGRVGSESQLSNLAPAFVLGAGWPLLIAGSLLIGPVWRWLDPWDAVARAVDREDGSAPSADVWWAVVPALGFVWYLGAYPYPESLSPRTVALALSIYAVAMVAGSLVAGRRRWLSRADVFGSFLSWVAMVRTGRSGRWMPPRGAEVVLGVLAGGLVFGAVRLSRLWGGLGVVPAALAYATAGVAVVAVGFGAALWWLERRAREMGAAGSVPAVVVPAVATMAVALAMYADILFTSVGLLPGLLLDPFGAGGDPQGPFLGLCDEFTCTPLIAVQTAVLMAGGVAGAILLARRVPSAAARQPGMAALCLIVAGGVVAITAS